MQQLIERIQAWYRNALWNAAEKVPEPEPLVCKLLEETIELALEFGISENTMKRILKQQLEKHHAQAVRVPDWRSQIEEAADTFIVWACLTDAMNKWPDVLAHILDKMEVLEIRKWRLNEYGGLSHIPNPGSEKAVLLGCTCARMDNHYGHGFGGDPKRFVMNDACPLHGVDTPWRK